MVNGSPVKQTVDHLFRRESGKMIAVLSRLLGLAQLDEAEDIVQDTLLQALNTWGFKGLPENPSAWLYHVAKNKAIDKTRREKNFRRIKNEYGHLLESEYTLHSTVDHFFESNTIEDSQLQMIFACCHPSIPVDSQIALALKTLCGLSASEIAKAFLTSEETVSKRIYRAKEKIKSEKIQLEMPASIDLPARMDTVLHCVYLLFNEGYNSSHPERLIREELCEEAMRLTFMLTRNTSTNYSRANALLALFCFQASRFPARLDDNENIILLRQQDRRLWYRPLIEKGFEFMLAAANKETSIYHIEAAIAYMHAAAYSFEKTDWKSIYFLYGLLFEQQRNPIIALNKAIAALYSIGASAALQELKEIKGLDNHYLYHTAIGEAYFESGAKEQARKYYETALSLTSSAAERALLRKKIRNCDTHL